MNILIAAIGKLKSGPELALLEYYTKRIPWNVTTRECDLKKETAPAARKEKEAELLLRNIGDAHLIALDEQGEQIASTEFASHLRKVRDNGTRHVAFAIGGADGLHDSVLKRAQRVISFGRVTWPHLLVRGLLAEQLYRAHTILSGHPYHRE